MRRNPVVSYEEKHEMTRTNCNRSLSWGWGRVEEKTVKSQRKGEMSEIQYCTRGSDLYSGCCCYCYCIAKKGIDENGTSSQCSYLQFPVPKLISDTLKIFREDFKLNHSSHKLLASTRAWLWRFFRKETSTKGNRIPTTKFGISVHVKAAHIIIFRLLFLNSKKYYVAHCTTLLLRMILVALVMYQMLYKNKQQQNLVDTLFHMPRWYATWSVIITCKKNNLIPNSMLTELGTLFSLFVRVISRCRWQCML